ncbi:MAG: DUF655 domain-containing protein [Candidatus Micrarchaeota archaeon]
MFRKEDYALVLDFLPHGKAGEGKQEPTAQVIGDAYFTLLEVVLKPNIAVAPFERVYIGKDVRDKVERIKSRLVFKDLTNVAQQEAERAIVRILETHEEEFIGFLNRAGSINIRIHSLEHLPGVGKKNLEAFLAEREKVPFKNYEDINTRLPHLQKIEEIILHRVIQELKAEEKYYLFVKIPPREADEEGNFGRERHFGHDRRREEGFDRRHGGFGNRY